MRPHEGRGQTATLTGLEAATLYQVQVRARNEEGTGRWSEPGEGWTLAGPAARPAVFRSRPGRHSFTSQGTSPELRVGYGQVETDAGMAPPAGLAIFSSRVNGILVSEAGVPAVPPVLEGRIFAETDGPVRTGLALANPNDTAATITFFFTNSDGIDSGTPHPDAWTPGTDLKDSWTRIPLTVAPRCWAHSPSPPTCRSPSSRYAGSSMSAPSS